MRSGYRIMNRSADFAHRIRRALDEGARRMDAKILARLKRARRRALERGAAIRTLQRDAAQATRAAKSS
jgi:Protein of unknown function (DUF3619)